MIHTPAIILYHLWNLLLLNHGCTDQCRTNITNSHTFNHLLHQATSHCLNALPKLAIRHGILHLVFPRVVHHRVLHLQLFTFNRVQDQAIHFFVRFINGNIRICQGCRGSLRLPDGSIPGAPNDITVVRLEKRPYFDKTSGMWC